MKKDRGSSGVGPETGLKQVAQRSQRSLPTREGTDPRFTPEFPPLNWTDTVDVLEHCTIQHRFVYQQTFPWVIAAITLWFLSWVQKELIGNIYLNALIPGAALVASLGAFGAVLYWEAYRLQVVYKIVEFRWFSIRGVFLKTVNSTPFTPFSAIEMRQTLLDWIFDTWRIQLHCDFVRDDTIHLLPGLSFDDAAKVYRMYSREVDRQISVSDSALQAEGEWLEQNWPTLRRDSD